MLRRIPPTAAVLVVVTVFAGGCGRGEPVKGDPPWARRDVLETLREDLEAVRHPSDGAGRAWLLADPQAVAGSRGTWDLVYEAGPLGIAEGGWLFLQVSPFWGWSTPQVEEPELPGFTEVETAAPGVTLEASTLDAQLLGVRVGGRRLEAGERVSLRYGAGAAGAAADRYAEARSPFWFAVDGDGDGIRGLLAEPPTVRIRSGPPARLVLTLPSTARPGETVRLVVALLDSAGNAWAEGEVAIELTSELAGPRRLELSAEASGVGAADFRVPRAGIFTVTGVAGERLRAESNPLVAGERPRIRWADLHGHSGISDGTGTPEDYFRYARDVAALDVVALTDHDHWGMLPLALHPEIWREIGEAAREFDQPGRMLALVGYEWTNWVHGHRHVLFFDESTRGAEVLSSVDPRYETPDKLWGALAGRRVLTVAHHSAGGPVATDWSFAPPLEVEPVTEVVSVHGASEAPDAPGRIYSPVPGNYVRDALDRGYRLGFVGSGDGHDGHPGLSHLAGGLGGLAAIFSQELTRDSILEALRRRHTYATNGRRIALWTELAGRPMGERLAPGPAGEMTIEVAGTAPIDRVDGIRSGRTVTSFDGGGRTAFALAWPVGSVAKGEYVYVRVIQEDGGAAWSSPYFFGEPR